MLARGPVALRTLEYVFGRRKHRRSTSQPVTDQLAAIRAARGNGWILPEELPTVVACRTLIADMVAMCPLVHVGPDGQPVANPSPIVTQPDPYEDPWQTHHRSVMDLTRAGRTWIRPTGWSTVTGRPVAVTVLDDNQVSALQDQRTMRVTGARWQTDELSVDAGQIKHVPLNVTSSNRVGASPLTMSWPVMQALADAYRLAGSVWSDGADPSIVLSVEGRLGEGEPAELRQAWIDTHGGKRVPAVLWGGAKAEPFSAFNEHEKLATALSIISAEAPRAYRVPPSMVNAYMAGASLTYSTTRDEMTRFITTCLRAYLMRLEAAYTSFLPRGDRAKFDTSPLTEDLAAEAEATSGDRTPDRPTGEVPA